ncbi:GNAT family N-acetyltransferase [uncultured Bacteroides sp.]|uniref:GNAT family N-acetyltransferase n=1 Tax=uncultured Bacteroides sp. TaxID=162156 RepID=UPI0026181746|nr:GNAT family N-acetyltransferase [uncultured Bacteroides sp.]
MKPTVLHNEKIRLRAPEPEDIDVMLDFENDEEVWDCADMTGPYSRYHIKKYIAESQNNLFADGQLRLMIEVPGGEVAGIIDLFSFDSRHRRAEVGIVVRKDYRRQGIARAALELLEHHSFRFLGIHQLYVYLRKDNAASMNLFLSAGYKMVGTLTDWLYDGTGYKDVCILQKIR